MIYTVSRRFISASPVVFLVNISQNHAFSEASLVAQMVKNLPANAGDWVRSLDQEDPPEKGMATHSSILAWEIPWSEEPGRLQSIGLQKSQR